MTPNQQHAFSFIEMLITLIILSILLSIAFPSLSSAIQSTQQTTHANQMIGALNYARTKAITSKRMVSLCAGGASCNRERRWKQQIIIFIDLNQDGQLNHEDVLLNVISISDKYSWHWGNFRNKPYMSYKPDGTTHSLNGTFTLCQLDLAARAVAINTAGRARLATPKNPHICSY